MNTYTHWTNSFDGVVKMYNSIKPLRGKRLEQDIRPIGERSKWWERIIKVDNSTYVITDGLWSWTYNQMEVLNDPEVADRLLSFAPIVWTREEDGDYITVRNTSEGNQSQSRYRTLIAWLPGVLRFSYGGNGKHWVNHVSKNTRHYLPKFKVVNKDQKWVMGTDTCLKFKCVDGDFVNVIGNHKGIVPVVNRAVTAKYNPKIRELWQWGQIVLPVFGNTILEQRDSSAKTIGSNSIYGWEYHVKPEEMRAWLDDPELYSAERLAFLILSVVSMDAIASDGDGSGTGAWFQPDGKSYGKFKNLVHKVGNMKTTKLVDME